MYGIVTQWCADAGAAGCATCSEAHLLPSPAITNRRLSNSYPRRLQGRSYAQENIQEEPDPYEGLTIGSSNIFGADDEEDVGMVTIEIDGTDSSGELLGDDVHGSSYHSLFFNFTNPGVTLAAGGIDENDFFDEDVAGQAIGDIVDGQNPDDYSGAGVTMACVVAVLLSFA